MNKHTQTDYEDACEITNVKSGKVVTGEILKFRPGQSIIATIHRQVKVTLVWQANVGLYIGNMAGMEFQSPGPKAYTYRTHGGR
jgi:hypothetical protein